MLQPLVQLLAQPLVQPVTSEPPEEVLQRLGRRDTSVLADAVGALAVVGAAVAAGGAAFGVLRVVQPGGVGSGDSQGRGDQKCQKRSPFLNKHGT